jgi:hypothetical protein
MPDESKLRAELDRAQTRLHRAQKKRVRVMAEAQRELERAKRRGERRIRHATTDVERCAEVVAGIEARLREATPSEEDGSEA